MTDSNKAIVASVAKAISEHQPIPEIPEQYSLNQAYQLQHQVTALRSPDVAGGVKLGVTNPQAQAFFSIDHALLGSLYGDARLASGASIPYIEGRGLETEFAVLVDRDGQPKRIAPAIEVVFVSFSRNSDMSASNLVLSNLGADLFIVGEFHPWDSPHQSVSATLSRDGELVNEASMNDALGGPASAMPWIWDEIQSRKYPVGDETLIMMGACGQVVPAEKGDYTADFGDMGRVIFSIG